LIRVNFVGALRDIAADVSKRIVDKQLNDTTMSALLYAKFRVGASDLKALAQEIRKRAVLPADAAPDAEAEYQSLMNELYDGYSTTRGKLILPLIHKRIGEIAQTPSSASDLVTFARSSIGYIRGVCDDEHGLWFEWFEGEDGLYDFLETICEPLHDYLRPRIIHEVQLLKLCELCTLLQTRYFQEPDEEDSEAYDQSTQALDFAPIVRPALEDTQTRIVFRAQAILRDEIEYFKPSPKDLDYPARNSAAPLSGTRNGPVTSGTKKPTIPELPQRDTPTSEGDDPILNGKYDFDIEKSFQNWYPTLRKAIWLLSRIYRLVNVRYFVCSDATY
jgi:conserved oligomeric Golgi complex subunit 3